MPTYEFTCRECGHHFDAFTSISRKSEIVCPSCCSKNLQESYGAFFVGGDLSQPSAGTGNRCAGSCSTCGSTCKTS